MAGMVASSRPAASRCRCAAGPANPYGDPAGHSWVAVAGRTEATRHVLTGLDDREANMVEFAVAALELILDTLVVAGG